MASLNDTIEQMTTRGATRLTVFIDGPGKVRVSVQRSAAGTATVDAADAEAGCAALLDVLDGKKPKPAEVGGVTPTQAPVPAAPSHAEKLAALVPAQRAKPKKP